MFLKSNVGIGGMIAAGIVAAVVVALIAWFSLAPRHETAHASVASHQAPVPSPGAPGAPPQRLHQ